MSRLTFTAAAVALDHKYLYLTFTETSNRHRLIVQDRVTNKIMKDEVFPTRGDAERYAEFWNAGKTIGQTSEGDGGVNIQHYNTTLFLDTGEEA